jgi:hypothetical protein
LSASWVLKLDCVRTNLAAAAIDPKLTRFECRLLVNRNRLDRNRPRRGLCTDNSWNLSVELIRYVIAVMAERLSFASRLIGVLQR